MIEYFYFHQRRLPAALDLLHHLAPAQHLEVRHHLVVEPHLAAQVSPVHLVAEVAAPAEPTLAGQAAGLEGRYRVLETY